MSSSDRPIRRACSVVALACVALQSLGARADEPTTTTVVVTPATPASAAPAPVPSATPAIPSHARMLAWGGASLFITSYVAAAIVATTSYSSQGAITSDQPVMWVPAAGPFIAMGGTSSASVEVALALDGLAQVAGLTLLVYSFAAHPIRSTPVAPAFAAVRAPAPTLSITPLLGRAGSGAAIVGTF